MTVTTTQQPGVVSLRDPRAHDPFLTGAKAASLARAAERGLPVLDGFVLTTAWSDTGDPPDAQWRRLSRRGLLPLVVRSSSVAEDGAEHSMAGLFTSVLDVRGWEGFRAAVAEVRASAGAGTAAGDSAMAVLVQPYLDAIWGGVLFTADPVSGRRDRMVLTAVRGGPSAVVGGADAGWTARLTRGGRVREVLTSEGPQLPNALRRRVVRMAARAVAVFGGPLDIEWAIDSFGKPLLLQARPITALHGPGEGPILGPGPLAETFPDPLRPLEEDLWLGPLDAGLRVALELSGAVPARRLHEQPIATSVDGIAVANLQALGVIKPRGGMLRLLDPRPGARRLAASVRVGRLSAALPELGRRVCERVDTDLAEVPRLDELNSATLLDILTHTRTALTGVHGYEALAGMLTTDRRPAPTAAAMGLAALEQAQAAGIPDDRVVEEFPVVLALIPPRIGGVPELPYDTVRDANNGTVRDANAEARAAAPTPPREPSPAEFGELAFVREALRLRARWIQELGARVADELGRRLTEAGLLDDAGSVALLRLEELRVAISRRVVPEGLADRAVGEAHSVPTEFRLSADGVAVPVVRSDKITHGVGAGGGSGRGIVHMGDRPPAGSVLVVRHLDPRLAAVVPRLAGLIAETGSPLSHVAILAREAGVPVVVGYPDATRRLPDGAPVELDGRTGSVRVVADTEGELS